MGGGMGASSGRRERHPFSPSAFPQDRNRYGCRNGNCAVLWSLIGACAFIDPEETERLKIGQHRRG